MKLLVVAPQPFFTPRGTPFSVYYRTLVTAEQGVQIDILTYGVGQDVDIPGVRIVRIPRLRWLEPIPVGPSWRKLILDFLMVFWTIGLLLRHRYKVVHAHEESVFWCRFLKPIFRFRLIYDMHSSLPQQLENFRFTTSRFLIGMFKALEDSSLKAADAVITICPDLGDYALVSGVKPDRHLLIENSIFDNVKLHATNGAEADINFHEPVTFAPGHPVVLYAGTFEAYQGIEILVEAFAEVLKSRPEVRLLLVGGADDQVGRIRKLAGSLQLGEACVLTGRVPKTAAIQYTRSAQVLVSPRLHGNNTPLKIYELLASGRPLVATRIRSHTQVLDDSVCYLVDPDAASLAGGLLEALVDESGSAARVRNAMALYERAYSRPVYERKIRRLLEIVDS
jgi:glycosyltransferase involved in cell wall biosynthesis